MWGGWWRRQGGLAKHVGCWLTITGGPVQPSTSYKLGICFKQKQSEDFSGCWIMCHVSEITYCMLQNSFELYGESFCFLWTNGLSSCKMALWSWRQNLEMLYNFLLGLLLPWMEWFSFQEPRDCSLMKSLAKIPASIMLIFHSNLQFWIVLGMHRMMPPFQGVWLGSILGFDR